MSEISKLAEMMREEWNRRVDHDYRFWMSDGYSSDEAMWQAGERDFGIITNGLTETNNKTILELGCGVGRLLHAAIPTYQKVIGVDVSTSALEKANELLGNHSNLQLVAGNGVDLTEIASNSIDVLFSFAAITSVPTEVIAGYLREMQRVIKGDGVVRLQVYLGEEQVVGRNDTLHLRCFDPENFKNAVALAGLEVEWIEELVLPFQVSFEEAGIEAKIVSLKKTDAVPAPAEVISQALLPSGEGEETDPITGVEVEYWMSLNYAKELLESGDFEKAKETLEYATNHFQTTSLDVQDLLDRIVSEIEKGERKAKQQQETVEVPHLAAGHLESGEVYERNLKILADQFPAIYQQLSSQTFDDAHCVEVQSTEQGPVISYEGQCLDHPTKPVSAGDAWAKRTLGEGKNREIEHLVAYGLGAGYHLDALCDQTSQELSVIEPSWSVFTEALKIRSAEKWMLRCKHLSVGDNPDTSFLEGETELLLRPQTQAVCGEVSAKVRSKFYGARGLAKLSPAITVLGPISGGTLPILDYSRRGLSSLHQRVREVDMSCFAGGFNGIEGLVSDDIRQRVARGKYTEMLSELILEIADEKPMDILLCMAQAPITSTALTELRKRGVITVLWFVEDYLRFPVWKYMAPFYDFIFTIQRGDCINAIKAAGAGEVHYLPTGCDPVVHRPLELSQEEKERWGSPVSFVGAGYHNRQQMFATLTDFPFKIWGTEWPECKPFDQLVQENGRRLTPKEYIKIFNSTDINLNLHSSMERDGVDPYGDFLNPRTFELAACGAFQLVDPRSHLPEVFEAGKEVVTFDSRTDLVEKIRYYLAHPEEREKITQAAQDRALKEHTYAHRLQEMLSVIYSSKFEHLKRREDQSPWKKMIRRTPEGSELRERCEKAYARGEEPNLDGLVADIVTGEGKLTETEQKLMFLFHVRKQTIKMKQEERGHL